MDREMITKEDFIEQIEILEIAFQKTLSEKEFDVYCKYVSMSKNVTKEYLKAVVETIIISCVSFPAIADITCGAFLDEKHISELESWRYEWINK